MTAGSQGRGQAWEKGGIQEGKEEGEGLWGHCICQDK